MVDMDMQIPSSQSDKTLPMIVHLRGDEDFVEDFQFDAQAAMELLGIKRSRLTQISGRELRVGRVRQDRYVRPVYRKIDLDDYQGWTRKTASHQSSSQAIEGAVEKLESQCQRLEQHTVVGLKESFMHLEKRVLKFLQGLPEAHKIDMRKLSSDIKSDVHLHGSALSKQSQKSFVSLQSLLTDTKSLKSDIERIAEFQAQFHEMTHENLVGTRRIHEFLLRLDQSISHIEEKLSDRLSETQTELTNRIEGVERAVLKLEAGFTLLVDKLSEIDEKIDTWGVRQEQNVEPFKEPVTLSIRAKRNRRVGACKR